MASASPPRETRFYILRLSEWLQFPSVQAALARVLKDFVRGLSPGPFPSRLQWRRELCAAVGELASSLCRRCSSREDCWGERFFFTFRSLRQLLLEKKGADFCLRAEEMTVIASAWREALYWKARALRQEEEAGFRLSLVLENIALLLDLPRALGWRKGRPGLKAEWVAGGHPPLERSGDAVGVVERGFRLYAFLADGMGRGERAGADSRMAVETGERLIRAGASPEEVVLGLNLLFLSRLGEERFLSLDLLELDLSRREGRLWKMGGAPSYRFRWGREEVFRSSCPPLGVLPLSFPPFRFGLLPGDLILLITDGVGKSGARLREIVTSSGDLPTILFRLLEVPEEVEDDAAAVVLSLSRSHRR